MDPPTLPIRSRLALFVQREIARVLGPVWIPSVTGTLWLGLGYRVEEMSELRRRFREIVATNDRPLLVCANHLTMIDSAIIAWAVGSPWWYLRNFHAVPWHLPERTNFANSPPMRVLAYVMKCVPITRGGNRNEIAEALGRFTFLVSRGDVGLLFPEGGRSRSGKVEIDSAASGVGRIVAAVPGCRVVCVYLRGDHQEKFSDLPVRGERFEMELSVLEPKLRYEGLRRSRDVARQIVARLAEMEEKYFDGRKRRRRPARPRVRARSAAPAVRRAGLRSA